MTPLAQHLVTLRRAKQLGSYDAARTIGITVGELFGYERGLAMPPVEVLERMAAAYGVTVDSIVVRAVEPGEEDVRWEPVREVQSGRTGKVKRYRKNGKEYAGNIIWDDGGDLYSEMAKEAQE